MPPIEFYEYLVQDEWIVNALYHEPGMQFCGRFTNDKGDEFYDYDSDDKNTIEVIPQEILDFTCLLDDSDDEENEEEDDNDDNDEEDENNKLIKMYDSIFNKSNKCYNKVVFCTEDIWHLDDLEDFVNLTQKDLGYEIFNLLSKIPSLPDK
jgi:hypothetical protein